MEKNKVTIKLDSSIILWIWWFGWLFTVGAVVATDYFGNPAGIVEGLALIIIWPVILGQIVFS